MKRSVILAAGAAGVAGLYTWLVEPHWVDFVRRRLPIRGLPRDLEGRTLVQISDVHVGPSVDDRFLLETFRQIAATRPDIVVITGDFVSYRTPEQLTQLQRVMESLPLGRLATLAVLGNHDYGHNWAELPVADRVAEIVTRAGVTLMRNDVRLVSGLQVVGVDDFWSPRFDVRRALAQRDAEAPASLVLCHNPDGVDQPGWDDYSGWILAGHTHGGQCRPPFLPPPLIPVRNRRYTEGEFALDGGRRLYINRGLGHLLKVRFNVRPEVTLFHLTRA